MRTDLGREVRKAFVAEKGKKLVGLDYSQIELRLAAHMSGDKKMIKAFRDGADIHTMTAAEINQVSPEAVSKNMRREAKAINFGILYGQGPHGLSQSASIPYGRAKNFIDQYFIAYKDVKKFIDKTISEAREEGYVETMFGRRRYLPEINSSVMQVRKGAERMAVNTPLQGTAADMIKAAMIEVYRLIANNQDVKMLLQVHDELVFEIKEKEVKNIVPKIKEIMENILKLDVPILVEASVGDNWREMEKIIL
jgi:DNA polymerase-1